LPAAGLSGGLFGVQRKTKSRLKRRLQPGLAV
jgi:hypothetical protein